MPSNAMSLFCSKGNVTPDAVPTKKNRRQNDLGPVPGSPTADSEAPSNGAEGSTTTGKGVEGEKVQHIRKRVEDLTWKERREQELGTEVTGSTEEEASAAQGAQDGDVSEGQAQEAGPSSQQSKTLAEETSRPPVTPARKQPTFSSFSSAESPFAAATSAGASDSSTVASTSSASTPARTQPTFSSFSSAASPLAAAAKAGGSASPFLSGSSSAAAPGGGIKPSPLGAAVGSPSAGSTPTPPRSVTPLTGASTPKAGPGGNALGFGAFAGASPFAKAGASPNAESSANQSETKANGAAVSDGLDSGASEPSAEKLASASSFGDILSGGAQDGKQADGNYATSADKKSGETEAGAKAKIALEEQNCEYSLSIRILCRVLHTSMTVTAWGSTTTGVSHDSASACAAPI